MDNGSKKSDALKFACALKYGNTRYLSIHRVEREITGWKLVFSQVCDCVGLRKSGRRILAVGINDGMDVEGFDDCSITGVDLCLPALVCARKSHPKHTFLHQDAEATTFPSLSFNGYLALRLVNSSTINLNALLEEMKRLLMPRSPFVFSIANGHWEDGVFFDGMFIDGIFSETAPKLIQNKLEISLSEINCSSKSRYHLGETFIFGNLGT